jgi:hypothetical protein
MRLYRHTARYLHTLETSDETALSNIRNRPVKNKPHALRRKQKNHREKKLHQ